MAEFGGQLAHGLFLRFGMCVNTGPCYGSPSLSVLVLKRLCHQVPFVGSALRVRSRPPTCSASSWHIAAQTPSSSCHRRCRPRPMRLYRVPRRQPPPWLRVLRIETAVRGAETFSARVREVELAVNVKAAANHQCAARS
eukprot:SAG11_NODE_12710_length_689_cov_0.961017_1_plen_138_part_10